MKRVAFLCCLAVLGMLISCAEKLPTPTSPDVDTLYVHDTTTIYDSTTTADTLIDTIYIDDTLVIYDTTIIVDTVGTDTVTVVDTIYIDSTTTEPYCGTLDSKSKQIKWFVPLEPGLYTFRFFGSTDRDKPEQQLTVTIGNTPCEWPIASQPELTLTFTATSSRWVVITANPPPARGHAIQICLEIQKT